MALPKLNDIPKYEMTIPSTKQKVRYRPFLVKEEKVMLMAMESENQKSVMNTIIDTISSCVLDDLNTKTLTTFDVEYAFMKIRGKSVGETATLNLKCDECKTENEVSVNIDKIDIDVPEIDNIIPINSDISVEMRWPSYLQVLSDETIVTSESSVDQMFGLVRSCISSIMTEEERFNVTDYSREELDAFVESMSSDQFNKIKEYIEAMPKLQHEVKYACNSCGHNNQLTIEGMQNFF